MRKSYIRVGVACLCGVSLMLSSCIGSFTLSNKLLSWNHQIGSKFVNELVFVAFWILPVYEVSGLADLLVLNSIEFWSGNNPVAKGTRVIEGNDGRYLVNCDGKGYTVKSVNDGTEVRLDFDQNTQSWYLTNENESRLIFTFVDDTHIKLPSTNGEFKVYETSPEGVQAYEAEISKTLFAGL